QENGRWFVEDLGSRAGTWRNGRAISGREPVAAGDRLGLGGSVLTVAGGRPRSVAASGLSGGIQPGMSIFRRAEDLLKGSSVVEPTDADRDSALARRTERLELLNQVHQALGRSIALDELLELILDSAFRALQPEEGMIVLREGPGQYSRAASRRRPGSTSDELISTTLLEEVVEKRQAALVCDVAQDEKFGHAASLLATGVRSLIAAPLYDDRGALGMLALDSRATVRNFDEDDLELLTSLASVASLRIRNVALAEEAAERRRLEEELALARSIQVGLLPRELPRPAGWSVFGSSVPSRWVSGDYFLLAERNGALEAMVADVSGKGIGAALLTASLEALSAGPLEAGHPVDEVFRRISRRLFQRTPPSKYATAFLARIELASGRAAIANAGHNPALLVRRDGTIEAIGATGTPVGLLPEADYTQRDVELAPGDLLAIYSDGYVEAPDRADEEFGLERLSEVLARRREVPLEQLAREIDGAVRAFVGGEPDADDRTLVLVRRDPAGG
ncbi:MAG TPA: SpoIIE family protein phosphatase, partial [Thermoanaerobaculia bacterium]|nr:SpoIIE family protein phosphatase [Thermoanaerobaculia bacterium]